MSPKPILGLTMGDPAGVGPEICVRALREPSVLAECVPVLFGDVRALRRLAQRRLPACEARVVALTDFNSSPPADAPLIVDCATPDFDRIEPGQISAAAGRASYRYIEEAIRSALSRKIAAVVTAPIHKEALRLSGIAHPGHTEIFTALTGAPHSCMMLYSDKLTVSMVTTHIGYQGHIPFKMLAFDTGVNLTLGLPIIRTSVDHGTAFDIAWQGKADPTSLYSAIRIAAQLAAGRHAKAVE